jgi:phosphocarrier protein HPr
LTYHIEVANYLSFMKYRCRALRRLQGADADEARLIMVAADHTLSRTVTIVNALGLHARSAAKIAQLAQQAQSNVWIKMADEAADASSIIDILAFACEKGSQITVAVDDPGDRPVLERIVKLIENGFGE